MGQILKLIQYRALLLVCAVIIASSVFFACSDSECSESTVTDMNVNFYKKSNNAAFTDTVTIFGLLDGGIEYDSILYNAQRLKSVTLPLRLDNDSTSFVFNFLTAAGILWAQDTITFVHRNDPHFISEACGFVMYFKLDTVIYTTDHIDSISVNNNMITNDPSENIRIFFKN